MFFKDDRDNRGRPVLTHFFPTRRASDLSLLDTVHQRASDLFYARGMHEDAIHHAIAACNYVLAVEIMNVWADRLIVDANLATVERWSDALQIGRASCRERVCQYV